MSGKVVGWAMEQRTGSPSAKLVLVKLADNASEDGVCWPSVDLMVEHTELSERSVREHLAQLEKLGLIAIEKRGIKGGGQRNVYVLAVTAPAPAADAVEDESQIAAQSAPAPAAGAVASAYAPAAGAPELRTCEKQQTAPAGNGTAYAAGACAIYEPSLRTVKEPKARARATPLQGSRLARSAKVQNQNHQNQAPGNGPSRTLSDPSWAQDWAEPFARRLLAALRPGLFETWFAPCRVERVDESAQRGHLAAIRLVAPRPLIRDYIASHFPGVLERVFAPEPVEIALQGVLV